MFNLQADADRPTRIFCLSETMITNQSSARLSMKGGMVLIQYHISLQQSM